MVLEASFPGSNLRFLPDEGAEVDWDKGFKIKPFNGLEMTLVMGLGAILPKGFPFILPGGEDNGFNRGFLSGVTPDLSKGFGIIFVGAIVEDLAGIWREIDETIRNFDFELITPRPSLEPCSDIGFSVIKNLSKIEVDITCNNGKCKKNRNKTEK